MKTLLRIVRVHQGEPNESKDPTKAVSAFAAVSRALLTAYWAVRDAEDAAVEHFYDHDPGYFSGKLMALHNSALESLAFELLANGIAFEEGGAP